MRTFLAVALGFSLFAQASTETWKIDDTHATAAFSIKHMTVTNVTGNFTQMTGKFEIDPADVTKMTAEANIDVKGINTNNTKRDDHLRSPDFFDVKKFPTMTFKSKKVEKQGGEKFTLTGDLTLHGVTKEVTLTSDGLTPTIKDPWGGMRRGFSATGELNRKEFNLLWNKSLDGGGLILGETVKLTIDIELIKADEVAATKEATKEAKTTKKRK